MGKKKKKRERESRRTEWTFLQRGHAGGQQEHERMLSITIIREMQIKATLRYHLTSVRMAIIKKNIDTKYW